MTAADLVRRRTAKGPDPTARENAAEWLAAELLNGARKVTEIKILAEKAGISERTLKRAKADLGVVAKQVSGHPTAGGLGNCRYEVRWKKSKRCSHDSIPAEPAESRGPSCGMKSNRQRTTPGYVMVRFPGVPLRGSKGGQKDAFGGVSRWVARKLLKTRG